MPVQLLVEMPIAGEDPEDDRRWCTLHLDGTTERLPFDDRERILSIPGLHEHLFHELLPCRSAEAVCALLAGELDRHHVDPGTLKLLDLGAGNGMLGERMAAIGIESLVAIDVLDAAAEAADRDRPGLYEDYLVADLDELDEDDRDELRGHELDALVTVTSLGTGEPSARAFAEAFNAIAGDGWIALNMEDGPAARSDVTGLRRFVDQMIEAEVLNLHARSPYEHRRAPDDAGAPFVAIVARKRRDLAEGEIPDA